MAEPKPTRLRLGRTNRRLSFERRIRIWLAALALPTVLSVALLTYTWSASVWISLGIAASAAILWALAASFFFEQMIRPLQTLSNVVSALREDDFSFRARGARRGDSLGDLALEINALAATLQHQRSAARDALTLVERVLSSMQSPVFAFDSSGVLRLLNAAASAVLPHETSGLDPLGRTASSLNLTDLLETQDQGLYPAASSAHLSRWSVRRATFRLQGLPHTLFVLSDISAALREEERTAWQRLIRVLGHEINNSLTPIHSIAGTLRTRLAQTSEIPAEPTDFLRGLAVIEDRAASLNRFLQAYQRLSRLPSPTLQRTSIAHLVAAVAAVETRFAATIHPGPPLTILCDPDQIQQALINLLRNAVDAALSPEGAHPNRTPQVAITWQARATELVLIIEDNGPGVTNPSNLFVPFYTTKAHGSGIGLVLAQQIASAHHGAVTLTSSAATGGCRAELILPLIQPLDAA